MVLAAALPADGVAADPVIAAAGDIACDPFSANINGGHGMNGVCSQLDTSELVVNAGVDAVPGVSWCQAISRVIRHAAARRRGPSTSSKPLRSVSSLPG